MAPAGTAGGDDGKRLLRAFSPGGNSRCAVGVATSAGCAALIIRFLKYWFECLKLSRIPNNYDSHCTENACYCLVLDNSCVLRLYPNSASFPGGNRIPFFRGLYFKQGRKYDRKDLHISLVMENGGKESECMACGCRSDVTIFNIVLQPCASGNYLKISISTVSFMLTAIVFFTVHDILVCPLGAFNISPYALMNNSLYSFFRSPVLGIK